MKISQLTLGTIGANDFVPVSRSGTNYKLNLSDSISAIITTKVSVATSKTLTVNNTITLSGTDGATLNIGAGGTLGTAAFTAATAYASASHTHPSADITDATSENTANKVVKRGASGEASFGSANPLSDVTGVSAQTGTGIGTSGTATGNGIGIYGTSDTGFGVYGTSTSGTAGYFASSDGTAVQAGSGTGVAVAASSGDGVAVTADSNTAAALTATSSSGTNHAEFGNTGDNRLFIRRVLGLLGWQRGSYTLTIGAPADLSADCVITLPDASGQIATIEWAGINCVSLGGGTMTGALITPKVTESSAAQAWNASTVLNFNSANKWIILGTLTGDTTITTSNRGLDKELTVIILADASTRALTFSESWTWIGGNPPANLAAGKRAVLSLRCVGSNAADVLASWAVQP